ncbi:MAG: hypothetical protein JWR04_2013 [Rhodoglobus sp.]|nr:hypothetical protein [Rhodoglobus sp.]
MAKKVEEVATPVVVEQRRSGLAVAGLVVGAVIVAGALFGGGVLVGAHLPQGQSQAQFGSGGHGGFPGGPNGMGGPGPAAPGQDRGGQNDDSQP